jgi:uncharacterized membrane protein
VTASNAENPAVESPSEPDRWVAAIGYLFFLCFFSLWRSKDNPFIRFHSRQAFLLFLSEVVAFVLIVIIDKTVGRLPFLGLLIVILLQIAVYLVALMLSVMGFVKALFGERWEMPFLGPYSDKVPML